MSIVILGEDRKYRIAFNGVERQGEIDSAGGGVSIRPHMLPKGQREAIQKRWKEEQNAKSSPEFAAMIDIDAFHEDPTVVNPDDFIRTSLESFVQRLDMATT